MMRKSPAFEKPETEGTESATPRRGWAHSGTGAARLGEGREAGAVTT